MIIIMNAYKRHTHSHTCTHTFAHIHTYMDTFTFWRQSNKLQNAENTIVQGGGQSARHYTCAYAHAFLYIPTYISINKLCLQS